jgi:hypothetical protein
MAIAAVSVSSLIKRSCLTLAFHAANRRASSVRCEPGAGGGDRHAPGQRRILAPHCRPRPYPSLAQVDMVLRDGQYSSGRDIHAFLQVRFSRPLGRARLLLLNLGL